jgi:hypothetical protein
MSLLLS